MNTTHTIESLRKSGHKVRVTHYRAAMTTVNYLTELVNQRRMKARDASDALVSSLRRVTKQGKKAREYDELSHMGGKTIIEVTKDGVTHKAEAQCSIKDAFNRKLGNKICLARLAAKGVI